MPSNEETCKEAHGFIFHLPLLLQLRPSFLLSLVFSYSSLLDMKLCVSEVKNHINNTCTAWNTKAAYVESVGLPVLVMEIEGTTFYNCSHCVLHRGLICPIYCLAQVEKLEVKNNIIFSLLCCFTVDASGLQCVSDTREHLHFPLPISFHCVNNGCGGRSNQSQRWAASSFFLAEIQRIDCC